MNIQTEEAVGNDEEKDRLFVTALARGLEILAAFRADDANLSNQQLAQRTLLPKSTVSRLCYTLIKLGYLRQDTESGLYRLGYGVLELASSFLSSFDIRAHAEPLMREFAHTYQVSVSLAVADGIDMVYLETCRSSSRISVQLTVGLRDPIATTAIGRAYYVSLDNEARQAVDRKMAIRYDSQWPEMAARLRLAQRSFVEDGYCTAFGECESDVCAIGVPLQLPNNQLFSLNACVPTFTFQEKNMREVVAPALINLAAQIRTGSRHA